MLRTFTSNLSCPDFAGMWAMLCERLISGSYGNMFDHYTTTGGDGTKFTQPCGDLLRARPQSHPGGSRIFSRIHKSMDHGNATHTLCIYDSSLLS